MPAPRRLALTTLITGSVLAVTAACSSDAGSSGSAAEGVTVSENVSFPEGSTMARLHEEGTIRIGTKFDQPLFGLMNPATDEPEGFDVQIGKLIAARLGIAADDIEWVETVSANREPFIQQGRVDMVLATYTITDERKQIVDFGGPYYVAGQALMVAAGNAESIQGPEDLGGKRVCSVEGSASSERIRQMEPSAKLVLFDTYSKCADALKNGQADAVTTDNTILAGLRSLDPDSFELLNGTFSEEPYGIGVTKGQTDFVDFIDETLTEAADDGSYAKAWDQTAGTVLGEAPELPNLESY
jgi:glutamate transport system substrate-binding protein